MVSGGCELAVWEWFVLAGCVPEECVMPETLVAFEDPLLEVAVREPTS